MRLIRRWLVAGLVVWLPIAATLIIVRLLVDLLDQTMLILPPAWRPDALLGMHIPGLGVVVSLLIVLVTGALVANFLGRRLLEWAEKAVNRIPLVRSVYGGVKKLTETVFSDQQNAFREVVMLQYPREGLWTLGFRTGTASREISRHTAQDMVTVYVPTTPNPTSGYVVIMPESDLVRLKMSVEDALQLIISMGAVRPEDREDGMPSPIDLPAPPQ
ncbi:DUF502 domain-containing protein [bacterium]|nr:DUF502 domain-containing protein [bacterium]